MKVCFVSGPENGYRETFIRDLNLALKNACDGTGAPVVTDYDDGSDTPFVAVSSGACSKEDLDRAYAIHEHRWRYEHGFSHNPVVTLCPPNPRRSAAAPRGFSY